MIHPPLVLAMVLAMVIFSRFISTQEALSADQWLQAAHISGKWVGTEGPNGWDFSAAEAHTFCLHAG
jgi:hypothetical protein